jgi:hypothetical protein
MDKKQNSNNTPSSNNRVDYTDEANTDKSNSKNCK